MEHYPEAIVDLNRAIEIDPEYKWAIAERGENLSVNGALCRSARGSQSRP